MYAESDPFRERLLMDLGSIFDGFGAPKSFKFDDKSMNTEKPENS